MASLKQTMAEAKAKINLRKKATAHEGVIVLTRVSNKKWSFNGTHHKEDLLRAELAKTTDRVVLLMDFGGSKITKPSTLVPGSPGKPASCDPQISEEVKSDIVAEYRAKQEEKKRERDQTLLDDSWKVVK